MANVASYWFLLIVHIVLMCSIMSFGETKPQTLLIFRESLSNATSLSNWNVSTNVCNWVGVLCKSKGILYGLRLEGMGLTGLLDMTILAELPSLRILSFMNNEFQGPIPDMTKLVSLRGLYLSQNHFTGEISTEFFVGMKSIRKIYLANNEFTGKIPNSLVDMSKLVEVQLQNNAFEGEIPGFEQKALAANVANNRLVGPIPAVLSDEDSSYFSGNLNLCGKPLEPCKS